MAPSSAEGRFTATPEEAMAMDVPGAMLNVQLTEYSHSAMVTQGYKRPQWLQVAFPQWNTHQTHLEKTQILYWKLMIVIANNSYIYFRKSLLIMIFNHL